MSCKDTLHMVLDRVSRVVDDVFLKVSGMASDFFGFHELVILVGPLSLFC